MNFSLLSASIRFSGDLPVWLVVAITVAGVFGVLALYLRETKSLDAPYRYLLPALRASAVAMVLFVLAGPVWHHRQVVGTLGRVIFAVDTSRSMSLSDSQSEVQRDNRLQRASKLLLGDATTPGWLESIAKTHAIDVVSFDGNEPVSVWSSDDETEIPVTLDWTAEGAETDLAGPLEMTLSSLNLDAGSSGDPENATGEFDSVRRAAVVLMTDGRDTTQARRLTTSASALAKRLSAGGTTVNTLGIGSVDEPPDLGIVEVIRPETVASEGKLAGEVIVKRYGGNGEPVTLRIESDGETVWQQSIDMPSSGQKAVRFELDVEPLVEAMRARAPRGISRTNEVLRLAAKVESTGGDFSADNNSSDFRISASTRNRRLLVLDGSSRWETRYVKNLFQRDPSWETDLILFGPGTSMPRLDRGEARGQFPSTEVALSQYDAIVLGEVDTPQLNTNDRERLSRFVYEGGGLIMIDGRHGLLRSLAGAEFADLMPVRYAGAVGVDMPTGLRATVAGLEQPALGLVDQNKRLGEFWEKLPAPKWSADVRLAEGAETWAEIVWPGGRKTPWLSTRMFGAGRVFYLSSDQTWRWRYKVADRFHARFWNQLVIAAMEPPYSASDQYVSLGTDRVEYRGDQPIAIRARLRDTRGNPVADATVDALVVSNETIVAAIPMGLSNANRGTYEAVAPPMPAGEYSIRIRASGFDESALLASTPIWVTAGDNAEMQRMSLDENTLRQVASGGEGKYVHESDAGEMLELLKPLSSGTVIESDTVLWQSYWWFWAIIALLTAEWWCRKRAGLV